ncbi:PEP-CTERM sorting domain-containing protein [bacterium]|nr:MAG: PEP-CTERM sorting domain-containing protein [bacterium]
MSLTLKRNHAFRLAVVTAALTAAMSAHAWIITTIVTIDGGGVATGTVSRFSSLPQLGNTYSWGFLVNGAGDLTTATFANGGSSISLAGTGTSTSLNGTFSFSGNWAASSIVNLPVENTGTYSGTFDFNGGYATLTVAGDDVVPEPASMAALGLGVAALARRRRR